MVGDRELQTLTSHAGERHRRREDSDERVAAVGRFADASEQSTKLAALQTLADRSDRVATLESLQRLADGGDPGGTAGRAQAVARAGLSGATSPYPHQPTIQAAFGRHSITGIHGHTDEGARLASTNLRARGYSLGDHVGFRSPTPSLFDATHEAVHYLQKRNGGVDLPGGMGRSADRYENQANDIAARVTAGESVEAQLDHLAGGGGSGGGEGLQLLGEYDALEATRQSRIRVANRRGSVSDTSGKALANHKLYMELSGVGKFWRAIKGVIKVQKELGSDSEAQQWLSTGARGLHLNRFVLEVLKGGFCQQFAEVVASRLVASTQNQWVIIGQVTPGSSGVPRGKDHGWVITSPQRDFQTANPDDVMIADAWDNFKFMNLARYLRAAHNIWGMDIDQAHVTAQSEFQAEGSAVFERDFPPAFIRALKRAIQAHVDWHKEEYKEEYERHVESAEEDAEKGKTAFDFERQKDHIMTEHDDAARLFVMTHGHPRVRKRAFRAWVGDAASRIDWAHASAPQAIHYLLSSSDNALAQKGRSLITGEVTAGRSIPAAVTGADLWKRYIKKENLHRATQVTRRQTVVQRASTNQLRAMRREAGNGTFRRLVEPLLTQAQRTALFPERVVTPPPVSTPEHE